MLLCVGVWVGVLIYVTLMHYIAFSLTAVKKDITCASLLRRVISDSSYLSVLQKAHHEVQAVLWCSEKRGDCRIMKL